MLNIENWVRQFSKEGKKATKLYGSVVTQIRHPAFYTQYSVKDTMTGRYELLVLHLAIVLSVLRQYEDVNGPVSRRLVESFVTDMDDNMRELGVGDMSVPKRVKKASAGLLERSGDYISSLRNKNAQSLSQDIAQHFEFSPTEAAPQLLSQYCLVSHDQILEKAFSIIDKGLVEFPDPASVLPK